MYNDGFRLLNGRRPRRSGICGFVEGKSRDAVCTKESLKHSERLNMCDTSDFER